MSRYYALGRMRFTIAGEHPVAVHVAEEFAPLRIGSADGPAHLRFNFVDALPPMPGASYVEPLTMLDDRFAIARGGMSYQVTQRADGLDVAIVARRLNSIRRLAPDAMARLTDWNHLTRYETIAKGFVYDVFDYLSQIVQLPMGQSHLHASSFERDGRGAAIIAWGGAGKTTAMLKLVLEDGWHYLSDDLVTIDRSGTLWRSPKRLQVYAYNVADQAVIRRTLMSGRSVADRAAWAVRRIVRGPTKVRRRVSAEHLFGPKSTAARASLDHAIYIERADCADFSVAPLSVQELACRAASTVLREMHPFVDLSIAMHSGELRPVLPSVQAMHETTRSVLADGLSRVRPLSVRIPLRAGPDEITGFLRPLLSGQERSVAAGAV